MYGGRLSGIFGYSHFVGGFAGGQAEYVRVPLADNTLLRLPDSVPDEKGQPHLALSVSLHYTNSCLPQACTSRTFFPPRTTQ